MPEPLIILDNMGAILMCPLEIFKSTYLFPSLRFAPTDRDGSEKRQICCVYRDASPRLFLPKTPLLFNIVGEIAVEECFLTARGRLRPSDEEPVASCWLKPRPNPVSDVTWRGVIPTVDAIVDKYGGVVDPFQLLMEGPDGKLRLQVIWQGRVCYSGWELPIFDEFGTQRVPASISQVPFGQAVHAVFSIDFVHNRRAGRRTVLASMFSIIKA
ncbi:hypothetical protein LXA43DRAFT_1069363 [Ganoderma leucocontextum]|nr:hypothetical protein LXA43DRAFT_1069363 [Ganoderma leucocontextum]